MTPTNKNLQDLFKTYVAKSGDEEKFRKTHVISTVDNNDKKLGPKDDQFIATTKTYERDASHHGYNAGGDEKVHSEETMDQPNSPEAHYKADLPNILKDIRGKRKSHSDLRREYGGSWKRLANSTADEHGHNYNRDHLLAVGKQHMEDHASQINEMSSKMKMKLGLYGKKKKMEEEVEAINERNRDNKLKKDVVVAKLGKQAIDRSTLGDHSYRSVDRANSVGNDYHLDNEGDMHSRRKERVRDYKSVGRKVMAKEVVEINELSKDTMKSYKDNAAWDKDYETGAVDPKARERREKGIAMADKKLAKEVELAEAPIKQAEDRHFEKQPPKMQAAINLELRKGKDYQSAVAAARRIFKEEVEGLDEITQKRKQLLGRYVNKAKDSIDMTSYRSGIKDGTAISRNDPYTSNNPLERKLSKRHKGISRAVAQLTKEEVEVDKLSIAIKKKLSDEGGAAAFKPLKDAAMKMGVSLTPQMLKNMPGVSQHDDGDYILKEDVDDSGYYAHREIYGNKGISKEDWKKGVRMNSKGQKVMAKEEVELDEKKLTKAELAKREEVAAAMEREDPGMDMGKKMAIATAQAKKVAEEIELGEAVHSDDAFDRLEKAGAKDAKTTSGGIRYTHGGKEYNLRHNMKRTGHRTVRTAELEQHLNRLQEEVEVVEEQFAPGKFKQAMLQRGLAALHEHIVGNE